MASDHGVKGSTTLPSTTPGLGRRSVQCEPSSARASRVSAIIGVWIDLQRACEGESGLLTPIQRGRRSPALRSCESKREGLVRCGPEVRRGFDAPNPAHTTEHERSCVPNGPGRRDRRATRIGVEGAAAVIHSGNVRHSSVAGACPRTPHRETVRVAWLSG
jgi:hypothetical protein